MDLIIEPLSKDCSTAEPTYYATRIIEIFRNLKERLSYQGGGSLPERCQKQFLKCTIETILDSVLEEYTGANKANGEGIKLQAEFDLTWLVNELRKEIGKETKVMCIDKVYNYINLMKMQNKEEILKILFNSRDWSYRAIRSIIRYHPILLKENDKEILEKFNEIFIENIEKILKQIN